MGNGKKDMKSDVKKYPFFVLLHFSQNLSGLIEKRLNYRGRVFGLRFHPHHKLPNAYEHCH